MSRDAVQNMINRLSLVMTIDSEIVKACKEANLPPRMVEVLLRLHNQQKEIENAINSHMEIMKSMAAVIDTQANYATQVTQRMIALTRRLGYDENELVSAEDVGQGGH